MHVGIIHENPKVSSNLETRTASPQKNRGSSGRTFKQEQRLSWIVILLLHIIIYRCPRVSGYTRVEKYQPVCQESFPGLMYEIVEGVDK